MATLSRNTAIYLLGGVVAAGGNILLTPVYLRLLSAEQYGLWSRFLLWQQLLQIPLTWGLLAAMSRLLADAPPAAQSRLILAALSLASVLNGLLLAGLAALVTALNGAAWLPAQDLRLLLLAAVVAVLAVYPQILLGCYVAAGAALRHRGLSLLGFALQVAVLGLMTLAGAMDAQRSALAMLLAAMLLAVWCVLQLLRQGSRPVAAADVKALLAFGLPVVAYTAAAQANDVAMRLGLTAMVSQAEFGAFSAVLIYASVLAMVASAVNLAWIPLYYRHAARWHANGVYRDFTTLLAAAVAVGAAFLIVFSVELLALYSGGRLRQDEHVVGILIIAAWLNSAVWVSLANPLFEQKRTRTIMFIALLSAALSVPAGLALIARWGVTGASLALLLNATLMCGLAATSLRQSGLSGPAPMPLLGLFALLCLLASPIMVDMYQWPTRATRFAGKGLLVAGFAGLAFALSWRPGLQSLRSIENKERQ